LLKKKLRIITITLDIIFIIKDGKFKKSTNKIIIPKSRTPENALHPKKGIISFKKEVFFDSKTKILLVKNANKTDKTQAIIVENAVLKFIKVKR
jgi:hypothetical protein